MDTWELLLCGLLLSIIVVSIAMIDLKRMIIPNALTLVLAIAGLGFQIWSQPMFPLSVLFGALALSGVFYGVRAIYLQRTGVVGLGLGDVKMAGASALWLHPANLPVFVFIACVCALVSLGLFKRDWRYPALRQAAIWSVSWGCADRQLVHGKFHRIVSLGPLGKGRGSS